MAYKCPFCHSNNTEEKVDATPYMPVAGQYTNICRITDNTVEFICHDCGQVSKIDPNYYREEISNDAQQEQNESEGNNGEFKTNN